jgi:hypothetical protein
MRLIKLLENELIDIKPEDIKIENGVMTLNQFPNKVGIFECNDLIELTSLENCPKEITLFFNCYNTSITSLEFCPKIIGSYVDSSYTKITSLDYAPLKCNGFYFNDNNILHLKGIGRSYLKDCEELALPDTIKSNILGLCRVKNLKQTSPFSIYSNSNEITSGPLYEALWIIKKYLNTDGSECQEELIQNGFNDYAKF